MSEFVTAADGVDPKCVPKVKLDSGAEIPLVGLGTFGSDHVSYDAMASTVLDGIAWAVENEL